MKIMIVGAGEVGFHIASRLTRENKDVVVVDNDPETLRRVSEKLDVQVLRGSGGSPPILEEAGIKETEILLAVTDSDAYRQLAGVWMTWWQSPFVKFRGGYSYEEGEGTGADVHFVTLQMIFAAGPHKHERY